MKINNEPQQFLTKSIIHLGFSPTSRETLASSSPSWTWLKYVTSSLRTVCEPQLVPVPWLHAPYSLSPWTLVWVLRRHLSSRLCRSRPRFPREQSKLSWVLIDFLCDLNNFMMLTTFVLLNRPQRVACWNINLLKHKHNFKFFYEE